MLKTLDRNNTSVESGVSEAAWKHFSYPVFVI